MSKQTRIKTADEIQAQQVVVLSQLVLDPSNSELPKPRGTAGKSKAVNRAAELRLKRTRDAGGLVDDHAEPSKPARATFIPVAKATSK